MENGSHQGEFIGFFEFLNLAGKAAWEAYYIATYAGKKRMIKKPKQNICKTLIKRTVNLPT